MAKEKKKLLTLSFVLVVLAYACMNTTTQMSNTTLSSFANYMWNSKTLGGYLTSFFNVGSILFAFFSGPIVEKLGKKKSLIIFSLMYGVSVMLLVIMPTPAVSLGSRFFQGIAKGLVSVAGASVVAEIVPEDRMNEGIGLYGLANTFAMAFGPMIALNLVGTNNNYSMMYAVSAAVVAAGGVMAFGISIKEDDKKSDSVQEDDAPVKEYKGVWKLIEKRAILPSFNYTVFFASMATVLVFITVYSQEILELSGTQISMFYTVAAVVMLVVKTFAGKLADKYNELVLIIPGHLSIILLLILISFFAKGNYPIFLICGGLYGAANATVLPSFNTIAIIDSPRDRKSIANATFYFMMDFGILFTSMVFGKVIDAAATPLSGYITTFMCGAGICVGSMLLALITENPKARAKRLEKYKK